MPKELSLLLHEVTFRQLAIQLLLSQKSKDFGNMVYMLLLILAVY